MRAAVWSADLAARRAAAVSMDGTAGAGAAAETWSFHLDQKPEGSVAEADASGAAPDASAAGGAAAASSAVLVLAARSSVLALTHPCEPSAVATRARGTPVDDAAVS